MSNNRLRFKKEEKSKEQQLKKFVVIGLTENNLFVWRARNVSSLFEVLGFIDLARDEIKKRLREVPVNRR